MLSRGGTVGGIGGTVPACAAERGQAHRARRYDRGVSANATAEELRAELAKRIALLRDKGYVDIEALPPPEPAAST